MNLSNKERQENRKAFYHLPGLFEFYELYRVFLPLYFGHPEYFYDWCGIGSIYGAPADCLWGGGRAGYGETPPQEAAALLKEFGISARLTFSNSLLREEHLSDRKCNLDELSTLPRDQKEKVEFLCNECCWFQCPDRKACYENVSRKNLGEDCPDHICVSPTAARGYRFSDAMKNPGFIGIDAIRNTYMPLGFSHFKIEGRSLGSALILEFLLYYMTRPEYQLKVREEIYLDSMLDLF